MTSDVRHDLLRALHPDGYRDVRALAKGQSAITRNYPADNLELVDQMADVFRDRDIYIGVASRADDKGRDTESCLALDALFADLDYKDSSETEARARLAVFPLAPSATVASGNGLHVYWLLENPIDLRNGGAVRAKQLLVALATVIGGDLAAAEPAHILRLPGTLNQKYSPPRPVVVEAFDAQMRYSESAFAEVLGPVVAEATAKRPEPLPSAVLAGNRHRSLLREGCRLRRLGYDESEIAQMLAILNRTRCHPPKDSREVAAIARSVARYIPIPRLRGLCGLRGL
jgi:hypothetical protein